MCAHSHNSKACDLDEIDRTWTEVEPKVQLVGMQRGRVSQERVAEAYIVCQANDQHSDSTGRAVVVLQHEGSENLISHSAYFCREVDQVQQGRELREHAHATTKLLLVHNWSQHVERKT